MRVAYDASAAISSSKGIARYINQLALALEELGVEVQRFAIGRAQVAVPANVKHVKVPARIVHASWERLGLPRAEHLVRHADVVHATSLQPPPSSLPTVMTVHDLAALDHPELHPARSRQQVARQVASAAKADVVIAVSEATANALVVHGVPRDRIAVIHHGVTPLPAPGPVPVRDSAFVLAVGELAPRKGLDTLVRALALPTTPSDIVVVHAGPDGPASESLRQLVAELGVGARVRFLGPVDDATLASLYAHAVAFCAPAVEEGFGMPITEAMAAGVPIVASDLAVFREVAGDAAVLVPTGDAGALGHALSEVINSTTVSGRLRDAGRRRAAQFTWAHAAAETKAAYEEAIERSGRT